MIDGTEVLGPGYEKVLDNGMVRDLTKNGRIVYSHDFYVAMYKKLEAGMDSVAAYESLGFDTKVTGVNRAYQAAKHAREKAAANRLYTVDPGSYDGSVPPEQMLEMADLSKDELIAYLKARNYYMEELVEAQKKRTLYWGTYLRHRSPDSEIRCFPDGGFLYPPYGRPLPALFPG